MITPRFVSDMSDMPGSNSAPTTVYPVDEDRLDPPEQPGGIRVDCSTVVQRRIAAIGARILTPTRR